MWQVLYSHINPKESWKSSHREKSVRIYSVPGDCCIQIQSPSDRKDFTPRKNEIHCNTLVRFFIQIRYLRNYKRVHTQEQRFECKQCGKSVLAKNPRNKNEFTLERRLLNVNSVASVLFKSKVIVKVFILRNSF